MNSVMTFINAKFFEFMKEMKNNNRDKISRKENSYVTKKLEEMDAVLDRQEKYSRHWWSKRWRHQLISIKLIEEHMNQKIKHEDIHRSHGPGNYIQICQI